MQKFFSYPIAHAGVISDAPRVSSILLSILHFLLSIIAVVGIISLIVAGLVYLTAYGDQAKIALAKKISIASVIGLVIAFGAWMITKTAVDILG